MFEGERAQIDERGIPFVLNQLSGVEPITGKNHDPRILALQLTYDQSGKLSCGFQYVVATSYATGDGQWGAYTQSFIYRPRHVLQVVAGFSSLPEIARDYLTRFPIWPDKLGWTMLPTEPVRRAALLNVVLTKNPAWLLG